VSAWRRRLGSGRLEFCLAPLAEHVQRPAFVVVNLELRQLCVIGPHQLD
jgi:hypothetical protein